jgi:hypothetical protein
VSNSENLQELLIECETLLQQKRALESENERQAHVLRQELDIDSDRHRALLDDIDSLTSRKAELEKLLPAPASLEMKRR